MTTSPTRPTLLDEVAEHNGAAMDARTTAAAEELRAARVDLDTARARIATLEASNAILEEEIDTHSYSRERAAAWKKKAAVMAALVHLGERGQHAQGWSYLTSGDLLQHIRPILAAHGLVPTFEPRASRTREQKGRTETKVLVCLTMRCALVDADSDAQIDESEWTAESYDAGDKSLQGLYTSVKAAFLSTTLLVSSGPASTSSSKKDAPPSGSQPRQQHSSPHPPSPLVQILGLVHAGTIDYGTVERAQRHLGIEPKARVKDLEKSQQDAVLAELQEMMEAK